MIQHYPHKVTLSTRQIAFLSRTCRKGRQLRANKFKFYLLKKSCGAQVNNQPGGGLGGGRDPPTFSVATKTSAFSANAQLRLASDVLDGVLTSAPSAPHLGVSLSLCSSGSNARGELRALEGCLVSSKNPLSVRDGDKGVAGRNGRE